jgi:hypothetical protein
MWSTFQLPGKCKIDIFQKIGSRLCQEVYWGNLKGKGPSDGLSSLCEKFQQHLCHNFSLPKFEYVLGINTTKILQIYFQEVLHTKTFQEKIRRRKSFVHRYC